MPATPLLKVPVSLPLPLPEKFVGKRLVYFPKQSLI